MSNAPAHALEHRELLQLCAKVVATSALIDVVVLITVGVDGRPAVGGNLTEPEIMDLFRKLAQAQNEVANVHKVDIPQDN